MRLPPFLQVFVPSDSIGAEAIVGAGVCIASTDLLFNDRTVEQACNPLLTPPSTLLRLECRWPVSQLGVWYLDSHR